METQTPPPEVGNKNADFVSYEIVIDGHLDPDWSEWLEHMTIVSPAPAITTLRGRLPDQAALFGVLKKLHYMGLVLLSVRRLSNGLEREESCET